MRIRSRARRRVAVATIGITMCLGVPIGLNASASAATGIEGLRPGLAAAYSLAADSARREGISLWITSGKRSVEQQRALWRDGIARYGSPDAARRWVLPPELSTHVTGDAIDVGPQSGAEWLDRNGNRWGLCRTFVNEWWHVELATTPGRRCPRMWPDAATRADAGVR